ncbi:MAG: 16S rRNA (cytosine(1402)-N(4))-methyltransferase RsmH [SAR86 cluster bacterium]|nr:16S rRNA (cytosine(1402)-N(4))-methyltransferase RsmH [SAR86 cluster bacterium]
MREYKKHEAVMVEQVINNLILNRKGNYVDCTFGLGGHSSALLKSLGSEAKLTAVDRDPSSVAVANEVSQQDARFTFINDKFGNLTRHFDEETVDGILVDLGLSSKQLDDPERGFSFQILGPLDMRMDQTSDISAETWVNQSTKEEIAKVFWEKGEERKSRKIAELICNERNITPIHTTLDLVKIIMSCKPRTSKRHPATNIFRAIRMEVNSEMDELKKVLDAAGKILKKGGRLAVISFHSIEDRVVKRFIQGKSIGANKFSFKRVGRKYIRPNKEEIQNNPRSRSAILRVAEKVD